MDTFPIKVEIQAAVFFILQIKQAVMSTKKQQQKREKSRACLSLISTLPVFSKACTNNARFVKRWKERMNICLTTEQKKFLEKFGAQDEREILRSGANLGVDCIVGYVKSFDHTFCRQHKNKRNSISCNVESFRASNEHLPDF